MCQLSALPAECLPGIYTISLALSNPIDKIWLENCF
jgi:hypothetical protein